MKNAHWLIVLILAGCAANQPAPVIERAPQARKATPASRPAPAKNAATAEKDWRPDIYTVKKGDTLYSIGLEYGYDYKELAQWNNIGPPYVIHIGRMLKLKDSRTAETTATTAESASAGAAIATPIKTEPISARSIGEPPLKTEPKAIKEPYSEQALAAAPPPKPAETTPKPADTPAKPEPPKPVEVARAEPPAEKSPPVPSIDDEAMDWGWPVQGKIMTGFNEATGSKGVDITGTQGQPVMAAAAGKVVYSGAGLRGYGKLVIVKHNKTYLSAYAHNSQILVKEGQEVVKGQKIAEMGSSDTDKVKLHFEIRKLGKPVDPAKYLAQEKS
jgi:lipoprotein NlpD